MTRPLWRWQELCAALELPVVDGPDITGVSIDSRSIQPGELFIALTGDPGPRFNPSQRSERDGHDYVAAAAANGAAGVLVHRETATALPELKVADTLDGLWALGAAARARLTTPVVAVTGSSGKTTVKSLLVQALQGFGTPGSLNNHLGVPLSLARTPADAPMTVVEIGTNHPGEIAPLAELTRPHVAVVLNVHPAHRENFPDMAALRSEKLSISQGLEPGGTLVVHDQIDDSELSSALPRIRFGDSERADVQLLECSGSTAEYRIADSEFSAHVPGGGDHRAMSLAAVFAVMTALNLDTAAATRMSDDLIPAGRGAETNVAGITVIDDSYNANPESMRAALTSLAARGGRRFALLGEMLELGEESARYHAELAECCSDLSGVFCVGAGMRPLYERLPSEMLAVHAQDADRDLLETVLNSLQPGDTLLVKGSNRVFWANATVPQLISRLSS
jgi:UDP-N-acetylmuramoyl-tripeptide--D-alanyl-D-alanine ligase